MSTESGAIQGWPRMSRSRHSPDRNPKPLGTAWQRCLELTRISNCLQATRPSPSGGCGDRIQRPCLQAFRQLRCCAAVILQFPRLLPATSEAHLAMTTPKQKQIGPINARSLEDGRTVRGKSSRSKQCDWSFSYVGRGGKVALPPNFADLRPSQRLYVCISGVGIILSLRPRGLFDGRLLSLRVRQAVRSLASYGPRTRRPSTGT